MPKLPDILRTRPPRVGDTVVHLDYGLCRLGRARRMEIAEGPIDTVELRFAKGESRHVPLTDAVRIWGYGASLPKSKLDPIETASWSGRRLGRVRELRESIGVILEAARVREAATGTGVAIDAAALDRAADGFAHTLTGDQERALAEVVDDLRADAPMNRALIGDVGCGKTEVAVRAALAVAMTGKPVRLLAPTRVLARQHYEDLRERAEGLGLRIALVSGDTPDAERAELAADEGVDIFVGTRGLVGKAFRGREFAMTILDEEQKFGSRVKTGGKREAESRRGNLLRLSATPIPSTLAEARIGLLDVSVISEYPKGRGQTVTERCEDTDADIVERMTRGLADGGQVIVICSRIKDLKRVRKRLKRLMPDRRIERIHGKRKASENRAAMQRFARGESHIVCATSMLETGINVANANSMLVFGAKRFGLAQLHQLRGRVGRGARDAEFVLVMDENKSKMFAKRVRALEQMSERGDGLRLSVTDSVLRGSGKLCDDDQSGHASAVGLELFEHLVEVASAGGELEDLLGSVPTTAGNGCWVEAPELEGVLEVSRAALKGGETIDPYGAALSDGVARRARKIVFAPERITLVLANGETVERPNAAEKPNPAEMPNPAEKPNAA